MDLEHYRRAINVVNGLTTYISELQDIAESMINGDILAEEDMDSTWLDAIRTLSSLVKLLQNHTFQFQEFLLPILQGNDLLNLIDRFLTQSSVPSTVHEDLSKALASLVGFYLCWPPTCRMLINHCSKPELITLWTSALHLNEKADESELARDLRWMSLGLSQDIDYKLLRPVLVVAQSTAFTYCALALSSTQEREKILNFMSGFHNQPYFKIVSHDFIEKKYLRME